MAERGYTKADGAKDRPRGCLCPEEFDHGGKCQNGLRGDKYAKCQPCSNDWHHPWPCGAFKSKGYLTLTTACDTCGWDSAEHPLTDEQRAMVIDSRWPRDREGRVVRPAEHT